MTDAAYDAFRNRLESGGDENAYNSRSGALGKHQFLASTWLGLVRRHQPAWAQGLTTAQVLDQRRNGVRSDEMVALYDRESAEQLARGGYAATPGNLYLAHHFGAAGARKILAAGDDALMQTLVSSAAYRANPHLHGKTKAQVLADFARRGGATPPGPARKAAYTPFAHPATAQAASAPVWRPPMHATSPPMPVPIAAHMAADALPEPALRPAALVPAAMPFDPTAPLPDSPTVPTPLDTLLRMLR
jgi:hypothetical protein